ncbi:cilia- and flagella-associated protein 52-like [Portunus trituberculatus]|uniref:cilia- and flagella-associated protein 52-like n=1 Tax=Portunus trituberculatus TaxID=210409 RepID=UPI001E1CB878|nr:cilia- and flagella-associated protein 52-like [Portunus trituberculatus]
MKPNKKIKDLQLLSTIGFTGKVVDGLHLQKDSSLVYPLGVGVGVWDRAGSRHAILHGHTRPVVALAVSRSGKLIVSAQDGDPGCQARVVVWRYEERQECGSHEVHREEVAAVGVSAGEEYVASLGGLSDGFLVLWHIPTTTPICSVQAAEPGMGVASLLCMAPHTPTLILVGGQRILRAWSLNPATNRLTPTSISLGLTERNYTCMRVDEAEEFLFAATTTGDVVKVRLNKPPAPGCHPSPVLVSVMAPRPAPSPGGPRLTRAPTPGLQAMAVLPNGDLLVGDVGGYVRAYRQLQDVTEEGRPACPAPPRAHGTVKYTHPKDPTRPLLQQVWAVEVGAAVTSLSVAGEEVVLGTVSSDIYQLKLFFQHQDFNQSRSNKTRVEFQGQMRNPKEKRGTRERNVSQRKHSNSTHALHKTLKLDSVTPELHLLSTCHSEPINDVTFPRDVDQLVVCGGMGGVRVWNVASLQELLRVELTGIVCYCCCVSPSLHTIITGWSDGRLRGLGAESGRVVWVMDDAHHAGVNTVCVLKSGKLVSGGRDGRVRVWAVDGRRVLMEASQKEHRGEVTHLALAPTETRVLSCSGDGSCILWSLPELERVYRLTAHTVFLGGQVLGSGEVVTVGSDGSVMVWDRHDGVLLADLPASNRPITTITASKDDATLVTAGEDATIRVWNWSKGRVTHEGHGHSGSVAKVDLSSDGKVLASVGEDGGIFFWKMPERR